MPARDPIELPPGPVEDRLSAPSVEVSDEVLDRLRAEGATVAVDEATRTSYGRDWWPIAAVWATQGKVAARPAAVVRVSTPEQVVTVVRVAGEVGVPLTAAAGRSGVCGGAVPVAGGLVLDVTGLSGIVDVDDASLRVRCRAGTFGDVLEAELEGAGYTLGHWPQSIELSTVGGWVACRSAGQYSTRYGKIEDMVAGLDVVTGEGRLLHAGGHPRAAVGPDLTQLFVGSEGTLGVITEALLRVHPRPPAEERAAWGVPSMAAGLDACRRVLRRGATPAVLRLYDAVEAQRSFEQDTCLLLVLDEGDPGLVTATMQVVRDECVRAERLDDALVGRWLEHRNDVAALPEVVRAGVVVDTVELAGPWAVLPRLYEDVCGALGSVESTVVASGHCSHAYLDGACLYFTFAGQPGDDPEAKDRYYRSCYEAVMRVALDAGAAISHHHGVGLNRAAWVREALGPPAFDALVGLKRLFDPRGVLNPGKLGLPSPFLPEGWAWT